MTDHEGSTAPRSEFAQSLHAADRLSVAASALVSVAVRLLDVDAAGVALHLRGGDVVRLSASSDLIGRLDRIQAKLRQGPGLAPFEVGSERFVADASLDLRYPDWSRAAASFGLMSVHMTALAPVRDHGVSLDLYSHHARGIGAATVAAVGALAQPAAFDLVAIERGLNLYDLMHTREQHGRAQGILMERHGWSATEAAAAMDDRSRETGTSVRDVARSVIEGADLLVPPDPGP